MKDRLKRELAVGDTIEQVISDDNLPKGSKWKVI